MKNGSTSLYTVRSVLPRRDPGESRRNDPLDCCPRTIDCVSYSLKGLSGRNSQRTFAAQYIAEIKRDFPF
jgi:hypothetical protein